MANPPAKPSSTGAVFPTSSGPARREVSIRLKSPGGCHVWALSPGGRRLGEVSCAKDAETLRFTADVGATPEEGARMLYEVSD